MLKSIPLPNLLIAYRKLPLRYRFAFWIVLLVTTLILFPSLLTFSRKVRVAKADMYFLAPSTISIGQTFALELRIKTNGTPINAVESVIHYNPSYLLVTNMTTENSFCSFYLDNNFDTIKGEVHISCGTPNPGYQGDSVVVRMTMRPKIAGSSVVQVEPATANVTANNGKGTNILNKAPTTTLTVNQIY